MKQVLNFISGINSSQPYREKNWYMWLVKLSQNVKLNKRKMLGQSWKKDKDLLAMEISTEIKNKNLTKRIILLKLASIYNPLRTI